MDENIVIKGAKENNLKDISLTIPRNKLVVFTGVSGSGKSTLAFDTIFAEGQRRYVESLSSYARMFLGQVQKPNVESIEGLSPATVYGVATFYAQFSLEPKGKYKIKVCDGTACHVRGSMSVLNAVKTKLRLGENSMTTEDGMFSLEIVSCLGACGLAPVVVINDKVYPQMTSDAIGIIIDTIIKEETA